MPNINSRVVLLALAAAPFVAFGLYVAYLVVPEVVSVVVPAVIKSLFGP